jgi:NADPH:quinone reductase-like Zn-dependent oxidoreductase
MKAVVYKKYGPPEVLQIEEIAEPIIMDDEILIKVHASSVNTIETVARSGKLVLFGLTRLGSGIRRPKKTTFGADVAGEVVEIGKNISKFKIGDKVFGLARTATLAEFAKGSEKGIVHMPLNVSYAEAAAVPVAGLTALQYLRNLGNIRDGMDILIYGASGGIGTYAVQYSKTFNVTVTAVCSGKNMDLVKSLGADHVIDYTQQDFTKLQQKYDLIFDTVGKIKMSKWKKSLKKEGIFLNAGSPNMGIIRFFLRMKFNRFRTQKIKFLITKANSKDLILLTKLMEEGKMKSIIDKSYQLKDVIQAHRHYDTGHTVGKVVVTIN